MPYPFARAATKFALRDLSTSLVMEEMYRGAPMIYVDYTDYDETAHHSGPERGESLDALDGVDGAIATLEKAAGAAPRPYRFILDTMEHTPDVSVISLFDPAFEEVAAFEELIGSHGGLGGVQTMPLLLHPVEWDVDEDLVGAPAVYRQIRRWAERHLDLRFGKDGTAEPLPMPETATTPLAPTSSALRATEAPASVAAGDLVQATPGSRAT